MANEVDRWVLSQMRGDEAETGSRQEGRHGSVDGADVSLEAGGKIIL